MFVSFDTIYAILTIYLYTYSTPISILKQHQYIMIRVTVCEQIHTYYALTSVNRNSVY